MFKLAMVQMQVEGGKKQKNLLNAEKMIKKAANAGAEIILLPEALDLGWTHPSAKTEAAPIPYGDTCSLLMELAKSNKVYICSGLIEKAGDKVYNSAVLISSEGKIILHHRKINELEIGHEYYSLGNKLNVCQTKFGTIGLMICADAFANEKVLSQALCYMGADIILSPTSWAVPVDYDNNKNPAGDIWYNHYHSVAKKFSVWIAGVSNVGLINAGPWKGKMAIGNSLLINPQGNIELEGPYGMNAEIILQANIKIKNRPTRGTGWEKILE